MQVFAQLLSCVERVAAAHASSLSLQDVVGLHASLMAFTAHVHKNKLQQARPGTTRRWGAVGARGPSQ